MKVNIHNITDSDKETVIKAAVMFYGKLLLPILYKKITVNVYWEESIPQDHEAETMWMDSNIFPKEFEINLSKNVKNFRRIVQTIAHEMVHVKQFAKGEVYDHKYRKTFKWGKQVYNVETDDYWEFPWEIEAYGRELGLFIKFKDLYGISNKNLEREIPIAAKKIVLTEEKLARNTKSAKMKSKIEGDQNAVVVGPDAETSPGGRTPAP
jgi:hypothetical protein